MLTGSGVIAGLLSRLATLPVLVWYLAALIAVAVTLLILDLLQRRQTRETASFASEDPGAGTNVMQAGHPLRAITASVATMALVILVFWRPIQTPTPTIPICSPTIATRTRIDTPSHAQLLSAWREMVSFIASSCPVEKGFGEETVSAAIQRHPDFQSLRRFLSEDAKRQLARTTAFHYGAKIQDVLITLENDIDRIEREWNKTEAPKIAPPSSAAKAVIRTERSEAKGGVTNNCPNGICISGGTATNPTVNNYVPPQRTLTPQQQAQIAQALRPICPFEIAVRHIPGDKEGQAYADQISDAIRRAGCTVRRPRFLIDEHTGEGVFVVAHDREHIPPGAEETFNALTDAGVRPKAQTSEAIETDVVYVFVELNDLVPGPIIEHSR